MWSKKKANQSSQHSHLGTDTARVPVGKLLTGNIAPEGWLASPNYITGETGWKLFGNGDLEANDGFFRGDISGATGTFIDGFSVGISPNWFKVDGDGNIWSGKATLSDAKSNTFAVEKEGILYAKSAVISGTLTLQSGSTSVIDLASLNADLGTITAGNITIDASGFIRGGQTAYNTGTGFFLGYDTDAYKFSVGNPDGNYLAWNGSDFIVNGIALSADIEYAVGDYIILTNVAAAGGNNTTYIKRRENIIPKGGTLRMKFSIWTANSDYAAYGRIYRNGVAVGTEQSTNLENPGEEFSEDIAGWSRGDLVQLYQKSGNAFANTNVENFKLCADSYEVATNIS